MRHHESIEVLLVERLLQLLLPAGVVHPLHCIRQWETPYVVHGSVLPVGGRQRRGGNQRKKREHLVLGVLQARMDGMNLCDRRVDLLRVDA